MHPESGLVVALKRKAQEVVDSRWQKLVDGFRANLERLREQPKYPPLPEDEAE